MRILPHFVCFFFFSFFFFFDFFFLCSHNGSYSNNVSSLFAILFGVQIFRQLLFAISFPIVWNLQIKFPAQILGRVKPCPTSMSFIVSFPLPDIPISASSIVSFLVSRYSYLNEFCCRVSFVQIVHLQRVLLLRSQCPDTATSKVLVLFPLSR